MADLRNMWSLLCVRHSCPIGPPFLPPNVPLGLYVPLDLPAPPLPLRGHAHLSQVCLLGER